jgi:hypothetical protein
MKNQVILSFALLSMLLLVGAIGSRPAVLGPFSVLSTQTHSYSHCDNSTFINAIDTFVPLVQNTANTAVNLYGVQVNGVQYGFCETGGNGSTVIFSPSAVKSLEIFDYTGLHFCLYPGQVLTPLVTYQYKTASGIGSQTIRSTFVCQGSMGTKSS